MRIAVLTSQGAPGLDALLLDPARGPIYDITAVVSIGPLPRHTIPYAERPVPVRNLRDREQDDGEVLEIVGDADYLFLADYRYLVTRPLLEAFPGRIVVLHDGDLTVMTNGRRAYTGLHAVRNAILSGATSTRATAFVATEETGEGPLLLLGPPYPVSELATAAVERADLADLALYAHLHRRWMVNNSYGVLLRKAAELVSLGTMHVAKDTVWVDGVPGPCRLGDAPAACWSATRPPRRGIPSSCPFIQTEVLSETSTDRRLATDPRLRAALPPLPSVTEIRLMDPDGSTVFITSEGYVRNGEFVSRNSGNLRRSTLTQIFRSH